MSQQETASPAAPAERSAQEGATPGGVQSVDRAITILELLAREGDVSVSEVAAELGVHKSTASRLLSALETREVVRQNSERGKYQLGLGILRLAQAVPVRLNVVTEARPELQRLAESHRETVNLAILRDGLAINVDQELGPSSLASHNWIGSLTPLHATSSGKVLLAGLPSAERALLLKKNGLPALTGRTITSRAELERQLIEVAARGYATVHEEYEIGLNAIAVPVHEHSGAVVASISISGPAFRFTDEAMAAALDDLAEAGRRTSRRLGHVPQAPDA